MYSIQIYKRQISDSALYCRDTAGSERFRGLSRQYFRKSQGALLVFGYDDRKSFEDIDYWLKCIDKEMTGQHVILVASKSDLTNKKITRREAAMKAKDLGIPFVEVSAKTGEGVNEAFHELLDMMIKNMQNAAVVPIDKAANRKNEDIRINLKQKRFNEGVVVEDVSFEAEARACAC